MKASLSKDEVESYKLSLEHAHHTTQIDDLLAHLALTDPAVSNILEGAHDPLSFLTSDGKVGSATEGEDELYSKADRYIARSIIQCLNSPTPRVKNFRTKLRVHQPAVHRQSGLGILHAISKFMQPKTGGDVKKLKDTWHSQTFFEVGMDSDEVAVAAIKCKKVWIDNPYVHDKMHCGGG